jgi:hypothetical protein
MAGYLQSDQGALKPIVEKMVQNMVAQALGAHSA